MAAFETQQTVGAVVGSCALLANSSCRNKQPVVKLPPRQPKLTIRVSDLGIAQEEQQGHYGNPA
jgi:hypothetical protein